MNDIELVKAEFLDDTYIIPQNDIIYRTHINGDRFYFRMDEEGNPIVKASTTTIIKKYSPMSPFLLKWWCDKGYDNAKAALDESSMYGTFLHILWAKLLLRFQIDMSEPGLKEHLAKYCEKENIDFKYNFKEWHKKIKQDLIGFVQWVQDYKVKPIAIEMSIIGEKYSGTIDLVCELIMNEFLNTETGFVEQDKIIAIVDWKSGRNDFYDDYVVQLESYKELWNEKFPDKKVERIFNYGCKDYRLPIGKTVTPYRFKEQTNNPIRARWQYYLDMYTSENPEIKLESTTEIRDTVITIESDVNSLIASINPLEFLEEVKIVDKL
jgi:hypothetical protein